MDVFIRNPNGQAIINLRYLVSASIDTSDLRKINLYLANGSWTTWRFDEPQSACQFLSQIGFKQNS